MADTTAVQAHVETLFDTLPPYYITSNILRDILTAWVSETDDVSLDNDDLINQLYVPTATWGLVYWENDYGILSPGPTYEIRRADVMAKILGQGTFTKRSAKDLANIYSREKTAEYLPQYLDEAFKTRHDVDDLMDIQRLKAAFDEMKPAHLQHVIGLLVHGPLGPNMKVMQHITQLLTEVYGFNYSIRETIKIVATYLAETRYNPPYIDSLVTNGAWKLDGTKPLDGVNHDGKDLYIRSAESLKITRIHYGEVVEETTV